MKMSILHLRYLIERQKEINSLYLPVPDRILPQNGEEIDDGDIDNVDDLLDLLSLRQNSVENWRMYSFSSTSFLPDDSCRKASRLSYSPIL